LDFAWSGCFLVDCIFCKIVSGEVSHNKVFENKNFIAFLDTNPLQEGHLLLIPKKHTDYIFDIPDEEYTELFALAKKIAKPLRKVLNSKRIGIAVEGFGVPHAHVHLIPINQAHAMDPCKQKPANKEDLSKLASRIRVAIGIENFK
jgi:histidine triad (HIT) family protein